MLGGASNAASGAAAVVCGGDNNTAAGRRSFASGHLAVAAHAGSVVLGDSTENTVRSGRDNQLTVQHGVRCTAGGRLKTHAMDLSMCIGGREGVVLVGFVGCWNARAGLLPGLGVATRRGGCARALGRR